MLEADFDITEQAMASDRHDARFREDDKLYVQFYLHPHQNRQKSIDAGRPIYEDTPFVRIMVPGDKDNVIERPVQESDKMRFARQYMAFQAQEKQVAEGTPLTEWNGVSRSQVEELKFFGVTTVEALVGMPDSQAQKFAGIQNLKAKAKAFLEDASLSAPYEKLQAENDQLKNQLAAMQDQIDQLVADGAKDNGAVQNNKRGRKSGS